MQLFITKIDEEEKPIEQKLESAWLDEVLSGQNSTEFRPNGSQSLTVWVRRTGSDILLRSDSGIRLKTDCAACLTEFELEVPVVFSLTLKLRPAPSAELPEELELTREDLEEYFYEGESIDLSEVLREQVLLSLPMYPRCQETCRGLCPVCGVNLNEQSCSCEREEIDPRWVALRTITKR